MNQPKKDRELEIRIVEFEEWRRANDSNDIDTFCTERQLAPEIEEGLKQIFQMEDDISKLVEAAPEMTKSEATDLISNKIGNYQLEKKLGVGGMGTVWLAQQSHPVKRKVAVKLIRRDRRSKTASRRFEREKQALALMSHTHIAKVFDAGTSDNDRPYIAMEFVDGQPITDFCTDRQLSLADRLELFLQLCSAIQHAHQNGLLHRDIKPGNVLVTEVEGTPCVKVIDFGLVRPSDNLDPEITEADMVVGSPLWMSPEQARGIPSDASSDEAIATVDIRADIYSLGVILYQLLTETTPITNEYYAKATRLELLKTIHEETPDLPSFRAGQKRLESTKDSTPVSSWANVLRNELDWVVMRALEKDRDRRYPTVAAFAEDVQNYLQNEPVTARPPSFTYRLKKLAQRHKAAAIASAMIFCMGTLSGIGFAYLYSVASNQTEIAKNAETDAVQAEERKTTTMRLMSEMLDVYNPTKDKLKLTPQHVRLLHHFQKSLDMDDYSESPELEIRFRGFLANAFAGAGELQSAVSQFEKAIGVSRKHAIGNQQRIELQISLANEFAMQGQNQKARELIHKTYKESAEKYGEEDESTLRARMNKIKYSYTGGRIDEIVVEQENALELAKSVLNEDAEAILIGTTTLGQLYRQQNRRQESTKQFSIALKIANKKFGSNDLGTMQIKRDWLSVRGPTKEGGQDGFSRELDELMTKTIEKFGLQHEDTLACRYWLGEIAFDYGQYDRAIDNLKMVIENDNEQIDEKHMMVLQSQFYLGRTYYKKGHTSNTAARKRLPENDIWFDKSREVLEAMLKGFEAINLPEHSMALGGWSYLAKVHLACGNANEALKIAEKYSNISIQRYDYSGKSTQALNDDRRASLMKLGRGEEAIKVAITEYEKGLMQIAQPSLLSANLAEFIANTSTELGHREQALKYYRIAHDLFSKIDGEDSNPALRHQFNVLNEHLYSRDFEAAETIARKVLSIAGPSTGDATLYTRTYQACLGEILCEQKKFEEAKPYLLKAAGDTNRKRKLHLFELQANSALALCYLKDGNRAKAIETLTETRDSLRDMTFAPKFKWMLDRCEERLKALESETNR